MTRALIIQLRSTMIRHNRQVRTRFCRTNLGCCHVKILVKPLGFTLFLPCTTKNLFLQNSSTCGVRNIEEFGMRRTKQGAILARTTNCKNRKAITCLKRLLCNPSDPKVPIFRHHRRVRTCRLCLCTTVF